MRINKYLALKQYATRRGADSLIEQSKVTINGRVAKLGDKITEQDVVVVKGAQRKPSYLYFAYNKPKSAKKSENNYEDDDKKSRPKFPNDVFPLVTLGRNDHGLEIYTNDGRVTDVATNPKTSPEKEYVVETFSKIRDSFQANMEKGLDIDGYLTQKCRVKVIDETTFAIALREGKKHQVRRMCEALHNDVSDILRTRIGNIAIGPLNEGSYRPIKDEELDEFLKIIGF